MNYIKVEWTHSLPDEPILIYTELDYYLIEIRKVEIYRDGRTDIADSVTHTGRTYLSVEPIPTNEFISAQEEFVPYEITGDEFELIWNKARGSI